MKLSRSCIENILKNTITLASLNHRGRGRESAYKCYIHCESLSSCLRLLAVIISVLEGKVPDDGLLQKLQTETVTEDVISSLYAGLYSLLRSALRLPQTSLKPEQFKADLGELK